jgi:hypothetical protein
MNSSDKLAAERVSTQAEAVVWTKQAAIITGYEPRLVVAHHIVDSVNSNTNDERPAEMSGVNKRAGLEHRDQNPRWRYEGCDSLLSDNTAPPGRRAAPR